MKFERLKLIEALRRVVRRMHYPLEVMLVCVRWYAAYPLSFRHIEEMMGERGIFVDHSTLHRSSIKMLPVLAAALRRRKRPVGTSWRMDETYVKVGGQRKYRYRAVDKGGDTIDFLLRAKHDHAAARAFFERTIDLHGVSEKITIETRAARIRRRSRASRPTADWPSSCANRSTSTTSSNKTIEPSNESPGRCLDSRAFAAPAS